jgi:predicted nuclease of predicted toxin-antitoxin system
MKIFASLYTDEDIANLVATLLRNRGLDVLTTIEAGMSGFSDDEQLAYAASDNRCILTHNRVDYERLHLNYVQADQQHSGIIVTPQNNAYEVAKRVSIILNNLAADEVFNQLLYA